VTDFLKLFFEKGGVPMGLLKSKQRLMDTQVADIRRRWRERYGGYEKWIEPAVLDSDAEWLRTGLTFEEMGFDILDARNEAKICAVMDVPAILVGAKVGLDRSTYSNYSEARLAWWEDGLVPLYENYVDVIENQLAPDFGTNFVTEWDFSKVWAFQEERAKLWRRAVEALEAGGITVNEFRREIGLQDDPGQDIYLRPGMGGEDETEESTDEEERRSADFADSADFKGKALGEKERARHEKAIKRAMKRYLEGQMERVVRDVDG
jgi:phage portal protein BeeE